jgi:beta-galactosidase
MDTQEELTAGQELDTNRDRIPLDGEWAFTYDHDDVGIAQRWFEPCASLPERISLPGCPQAQEFGSRFKEKRESDGYLESGFTKYHSTDTAWYRRDFLVPDSMENKEIWLHIGGVTPAAEVWINGTSLGETRSSRCALRCDVTQHVRLGETNSIAIRVFVPEGPRLDGLFDAYCYCGFTGIYRHVWLEATAPVHISGIHVMSEIDPPKAFVCLELSRGLAEARQRKKVYVDAILHEAEDAPDDASEQHTLEAEYAITGRDGEAVASGKVVIDSGQGNTRHAMIRADMAGAKLWDCDNPYLHTAELKLLLDGQEIDSASSRFGLREIRTEGKQVILNGKPVFMRGGCDDHIYMDTVAPPADKAYYLRNIKRMKEYGFNYTKSCIEVFTKEYLDAADELGLLVCQEMPLGLTGEMRSNIIYTPPREFIDFWRAELKNIVSFDRNHPCVIAYSMTSEKGPTAASFESIHQEFPAYARVLNPQALVCDVTHGAGHSAYTAYGKRVTDLIEECPDNPYDLAPLVDELELPETGRIRDLPWILHEYSWWTSMPNPKLRAKYEGKPFLFRGVPDLEKAAADAGFTEQIPRFVSNSEKLVALLRKEGLELARRHPGVAGYNFWLITNFMATCPEGIFDEFWDEQMGLKAAQCRKYNADTVLLLDDGRRRCFEQGTTVTLGIDLSHFGNCEIPRPIVEWQMRCEGECISRGSSEPDPIPCGFLGNLAEVVLTFPESEIPQEVEMAVVLRDGSDAGEEGEISRNDWTLWTYPGAAGGSWESSVSTDLDFISKAYAGIQAVGEEPCSIVVVTDRLNANLLDYLESGGRVVLLSENAIKEYRFDPAEDWGWSHRFSKAYRSPCWNTGKHGNSGTVVETHPALGGFPHHGWCDLNFVYLIDEAHPLLLEPYRPTRIEPIIRSIGHFTTLVDKAYMFEVSVGAGKLLATSLNISTTYASHPETRYLLQSIMKYASGPEFAPQSSISRQQLEEAIVD